MKAIVVRDDSCNPEVCGMVDLVIFVGPEEVSVCPKNRDVDRLIHDSYDVLEWVRGRRCFDGGCMTFVFEKTEDEVIRFITGALGEIEFVHIDGAA